METNKITDAPILKALLYLSLPITLSNLLQVMYQMIDTFWVGRLGAKEVAAVSVSFPVLFVVMSLGSGMAIAGRILVSQYKGAKKQDKVDNVAMQTILSFSIISLILSLVGYLLSPLLLNLMHVANNVFNDALLYLHISFAGAIFMLLYFILSSLLRGVGEVKFPLYVAFFSLLLNLLVDPLFIFGFYIIPPLGVGGAALSSILTQFLGTLLLFIALFRGRRGINLRKACFCFDAKILKKMFFLGIPASLEQILRSIGLLVMMFIVASFGTIAIAAYGIGSRIFSFILIPLRGLATSSSILVGQNYGAGKIKRVKESVRISSTFSFFLFVFAGALAYLFSYPIAYIFIPSSPQVASISSLFIKLLSISFPFLALQMVFDSSLRGLANTSLPLLSYFFSSWLVRIPLAYYLAFHTCLRETGIFLSFPISISIGALFSLLAYNFYIKQIYKHPTP